MFTTLTYYAYLAWIIFAFMLVFLLINWPSVGLVWLLVLALRVIQFARLCSRSPRAFALQTTASPLAAATDGAVCLSRLEAGGAAAALSGSEHAHCRGVRRKDEEGAELGRVLLVGNGPSIRTRGMGEIIDSFDTIVRFNSFVTTGLEEHTGSRTSLWCGMAACSPT